MKLYKWEKPIGNSIYLRPLVKEFATRAGVNKEMCEAMIPLFFDFLKKELLSGVMVIVPMFITMEMKQSRYVCKGRDHMRIYLKTRLHPKLVRYIRNKDMLKAKTVYAQQVFIEVERRRVLDYGSAQRKKNFLKRKEQGGQ